MASRNLGKATQSDRSYPYPSVLLGGSRFRLTMRSSHCDPGQCDPASPGAMLARRQATVHLMRDGLGLLLAEGPLQHICLEEARDLAAGSIVVQGRLVYAV